MKTPKNTRDYGKFDGPRRMFARGGHVREPSLTEHLQTGPSWWPEPLGAWMNPKPAPAERSAPAPRTDHRALDKALKFAEKMARMNKESEAPSGSRGGGRGGGAAPVGGGDGSTSTTTSSTYPTPPGDNIGQGDAGGSGGGGVASDSSSLISQQPDDI